MIYVFIFCHSIKQKMLTLIIKRSRSPLIPYVWFLVLCSSLRFILTFPFCFRGNMRYAYIHYDKSWRKTKNKNQLPPTPSPHQKKVGLKWKERETLSHYRETFCQWRIAKIWFVSAKRKNKILRVAFCQVCTLYFLWTK